MPKLPHIICFLFLKKEVSDEVDFFHADNHESILPSDTMIFYGDGQAFLKVPRIASLQCLDKISKKKLEMTLIFCMHINIKVFYKLISFGRVA